MIGFHNHTQMTPTTYDGPILSHGKYLGINFDIIYLNNLFFD